MSAMETMSKWYHDKFLFRKTNKWCYQTVMRSEIDLYLWAMKKSVMLLVTGWVGSGYASGESEDTGQTGKWP